MKSNVISDKGQPMMTISKVGRKGIALEITGQLMGAWPSKMYITPRELIKMVFLALKPGVFLFILLYPVFLIMDFAKNKK
ncbi:MAG: hypothetical protein PF450_14850 [Bacteroidales bacterium]|jgi:hypothetical protein|nr:hypothetical protein [Bacteroidales bacterium]